MKSQDHYRRLIRALREEAQQPKRRRLKVVRTARAAVLLAYPDCDKPGLPEAKWFKEFENVNAFYAYLEPHHLVLWQSKFLDYFHDGLTPMRAFSMYLSHHHRDMRPRG